MTLRELERLSGVDLANILLYEREGLIRPSLTEDGYHDYSDEDLRSLLRTRLLRLLKVTLDEITAMNNGNMDFEEILLKRLSQTDSETQEAACIREILQSIQSGESGFANFDAGRYLQMLPSTDSSSESRELPQVFYPWRRYFARMLDMSVYDILLSFFLVAAFNINISARSTLENLIDVFITLLIMLFAEPLLLRLFGTTPGKAIFGIRVTGPDGMRLSYARGLKRTWGVIGAGMGYNIPIYNLVKLSGSHRLCSEMKTQPWDENISSTIKDTKWYRGVIYILAALIMLALSVTIMQAQNIPPNRGSLTIDEFIENYNYYDKLFKSDPIHEYYKHGRSLEEPYGEASDVLRYDEIPNFSYILDNGYITGVSFRVELHNSPCFIYPYDLQMLLSSLSFACAQEEMVLFSKIPKRISEHVRKYPFEDLHFIEAGIEFTCSIETSGYSDPYSFFIIPSGGNEESLFLMEFSMNKVDRKIGNFLEIVKLK